MVKTRDIDTITFHQDPWKPSIQKVRTVGVTGLDTETKKDGYAFLLTISEQERQTAIEIKQFSDFIDATWTKQGLRNVNFFYNIDFDFSVLAKYMGPTHLENLATVGFTPWEDYEINWVPAKAFTITKTNKNNERKGGTLRFFDVSQFYNKISLAKAAKKVGMTKLEFDTSSVDYQKYLTNNEYREKLTEYAIQDARITQKLGERIHYSVNQIVPVYQYYSTASIAQAFFLSKLDKKLKMPPNLVMDLALKSYGGGRFELVQKGFFPKVWEIDINSAYPKKFSELPATGTENGYWKKLRENDCPDTNALYGFYEIKTETHTTNLSPIMTHTRTSIIYPHGFHQAYVEKSELEIIEKMGFNYQILSGYEYFDSEPLYPFKFIEDLYNQRLEYKKKKLDDLDYVYKIIMNSAYGKTIQLVPNKMVINELPVDIDPSLIMREIPLQTGEVIFVVRSGWNAGKMFNPVYAAAITSRVRAQLLETVLKYQLDDSLIGFATDCCYLTKAPPESLVGKGLGAWKLEAGPVEGLFIGSGVYSLKTNGFAGKDEDINHLRGFKTKKDLFSFITDGYKTWLEGKTQRSGLVFNLESPVKLKEGVRGGERKFSTGSEIIDWSNIGQFKPLTKSLDLNFDTKRNWERRVKNPRELLEGTITSQPLMIR